jgi:hypothetical protein
VIDGSDAIAVDEDIAWSKVAFVVVHRDDIAGFDQDFLTSAGGSLGSLCGAGTEARESGEARRRRKTRGRNSGEESCRRKGADDASVALHPSERS